MRNGVEQQSSCRSDKLPREAPPSQLYTATVLNLCLVFARQLCCSYIFSLGSLPLYSPPELAFRPDLPTQIAERRGAIAYPEGQPSSALRSKMMTEGMTSLSLHLRLMSSSVTCGPTTTKSPGSLKTSGHSRPHNAIRFDDANYEGGGLPDEGARAFGTTNNRSGLRFRCNCGCCNRPQFRMGDTRVAQNLLLQMETDISMRRQNGAL
ncbi:hypothetical protein ILFOPFJJ_03217 [Ensifer psoraleae]|nr:hypothetical protein [Sinorhizobium psoraleae]